MIRAALADASSRRFFAAHAQSCLGSGLAYVALPLLAYDRFGSAWAVVAVLLPDLLPAVVLGPLIGALVDRWGWRVCAILGDAIRCLAFMLLLFGESIELMIGGARARRARHGAVRAGRAGRPAAPGPRRPAPGDHGAVRGARRPRADARPGARRRAAVRAPDGRPARAQRVLLRGQRAADRRHPRPELPAGDLPPERGPSLWAEARAGIQELAGRPEVRALLGSSTAAVLCIGMTNVGEVILAREVLDIGGSGLAILMTAGGVGTVAGSLAARFKGAWEWRRAYQIGLGCMAFDLLACATLPSFWLLLPVFIIGGFGNGFALVHDRLLLSHAAPDSMHGRLFALHKACTSAPSPSRS